MKKRWIFACLGAAALAGVASAPASAAIAVLDEGFQAAPGSTLIIKIPRLLKNDRKSFRGERIRFSGFQESFEGILDVRRVGNRLFVDLSDSISERNVGFVYRIQGFRGNKKVGKEAKGFVKIRVISPA
jgi:hypothetical protein